MKIPPAIIPNGAAPGVKYNMPTNEINDSYIIDDQYYQNESASDPKKVPEDTISERLMRYGQRLQQKKKV